MSIDDLEDSVNDICLDVFGNEHVYTPSVGSAYNIKGILTQDWVEANQVSSLSSIFRVKTSSLVTTPTESDQVEINSVDYRIVDYQQDPYGMTNLILEKI